MIPRVASRSTACWFLLSVFGGLGFGVRGELRQLVLLLISLCLSYFCFPEDLGFRVSGPSVAETPEAQIRDPVVRTWVELNSQTKFKPRLNPDSNSCRRKESESRLNLGSNFPRLDLCALA